MLNKSSLPKRFWAEATNTVVYMINRSPSSAINFRTPMHVWSGRKPSLTHIKPFGCLAYVHTDQGKLNPRASKVVFIRYPSGVKGYKVWLISEKKCVVSRNIIFHEHATMSTNLQDSKMNLPCNRLQFEVENHPGHHSEDDL